MKIGLIIPTYNAGENFKSVLSCIEQADKHNLSRKLIIDSESVDETVALAQKANFEIMHIKKSEFTHGEARRRSAEYLNDCDYLVYMTQDVKLEANSLDKLIKFASSKKGLAVAYGRQVAIPEESTIFEQRARFFNYPAVSRVKTRKDIQKLGIKTVFSSDAFSIYNRKILLELGSFPTQVMYCEDQYMAAMAIKHDYSVGYCADAIAFHSHQLTLKQQYRRYKSIGEFHKQNPWIQQMCGANESEGVKSVLSEWAYLIKKGKVWLIPYSFVLNTTKYIAYKF